MEVIPASGEEERDEDGDEKNFSQERFSLTETNEGIRDSKIYYLEMERYFDNDLYGDRLAAFRSRSKLPFFHSIHG